MKLGYLTIIEGMVEPLNYRAMLVGDHDTPPRHAGHARARRCLGAELQDTMCSRLLNFR